MTKMDAPPSDSEKDALRAAWMEKHGLRPSRSRDWQALLGKRRRPGAWNPLPGQDHEMMFCKDGKAAVFTFQPYGLDWQTLRALIRTCEDYGLEVSINTWPGWHFPGRVLFVAIRRAK